MHICRRWTAKSCASCSATKTSKRSSKLNPAHSYDSVRLAAHRQNHGMSAVAGGIAVDLPYRFTTINAARFSLSEKQGVGCIDSLNFSLALLIAGIQIR